MARYSVCDLLFPAGTRRRGMAAFLFEALRLPRTVLMNLSPAIIRDYLRLARTAGRVSVCLDRIDLSRDRLDVYGWAWALGGVERIDVFLDNNLVGQASYGYLRPDVQSEQPEVVKRCLRSIRAKTSYRNYEIVLADKCGDPIPSLRACPRLRGQVKVRTVRLRSKNVSFVEQFLKNDTDQGRGE